MSKKALTVDLATGRKKLDTIIDDLSNAAGKTDVAYSAKAVDDKVDAISSSFDTAVANLKGSSTYQNAVLGIYKLSTDIPTPVDNGRYVIATQFKIYHAEITQVGNIGDVDYVPYRAASWELVSTATEGHTVVNLVDGREYRFRPSTFNATTHLGINGTAWYDTNLDDDKLVHTFGDQTIAGAKTFTNATTFSDNVSVGQNLTVNGDLTVNGTLTQIDTVNLQVKDNTVILNDGDLGQADGSGISSGFAGIEVNRGKDASRTTDLDKAQLLFDENDDLWKVGLQGNLKPIPAVDDASATSPVNTYSIDKINSLVTNVQSYVNGASLFTFTAAEDVTAGDILYVTIDGTVAKANNDSVDCMDVIAGVAMKTVVSGGLVQVAKFGRISKFSGLQVGKPYYLDKNGAVSTVATSVPGEFINLIGVAVDATTILLQIGEAILIGV